MARSIHHDAFGRNTADDTVTLLPAPIQPSHTFEISVSQQENCSLQQGHGPIRPAVLGACGAVTALCLLCICTIWLELHPSQSSGDKSSGFPDAKLPTSCQQATAGTSFLSAYTADIYHLHLLLPASIFSVNLSSAALGAPHEFNASVSIQLTITQPAGCILLNAQHMHFWYASLVVIPSSPVQQPEDDLQKYNSQHAAWLAKNSSSTVLCNSSEECSPIILPALRQPQTSTMEQDLVAIDLGGTTLQPGSTAVLHLRYTASLGMDSTGLYRSDPFVSCAAQQQQHASDRGSNTGEGPEAVQECPATVLLVTQLEPLGARRLLPCLDGPRYKARFRVSLQVPPGLTPLSNMPQLKAADPDSAHSTPNLDSSSAGSDASYDFTGVAADVMQNRGADGLEYVEFQLTPRMSPYLLAVAVGQLQQVQDEEGTGTTKSGRTVRTWAVPGKQAQLRVAHQAAVRGLDFFEEWTGVQQPLSKFDYVAVPGKGGAMENWGLLLFDERRFLVNERASGAYAAWLAADVVCHETAHQWFGNLVTARDWRELTVNEGVASFMEYKCITAAVPNLPAQPLFYRASSPAGEAIGIHEGPMLRMLGHVADPVQPPLVPPSELWDDDDVVTYSKGASLLRMVEAFMDQHLPGAFQLGFQEFLQKYQNGVASMADLLNVLADQLSDVHVNTTGKGQLQGEELSSFVLLAQQYSQQYTQLGNATNGPEEYSNKLLDIVAANSLAAWLHMPGYPLLNASGLDTEDTPGQQQERGSAGSQNVQHQMYCSWQFSEQLAQELQAAAIQGDQARQAAEHSRFDSCGKNFSNWWLPYSAPVPSSLLSCAVTAETNKSSEQIGSGIEFQLCTDKLLNSSSSSSSSSSSGNVGQALWVMNPTGSGMYRTLYSQPYLHTLLGGIAGLEPCFHDSDGQLLGSYRSSNAGRSCMNTSENSSASGSKIWVMSADCTDAVNGTSNLNSNLTASCQLDAAPALAAASVLSDCEALAHAGHYPLSAVVQAAAAAAQAPYSSTGTGMYLLVLPALEALLRLRPHAAAHSTQCAQHLDEVAIQLFSRHAQHALQQHWQPSSQQAQQDASLGQLAVSRLSWHAVLAGDAATSATLCSALPATPLWRHMTNAAHEQDGRALGCPSGFTVASSSNIEAEALGTGAAPSTGVGSNNSNAQPYARSSPVCQLAPAGNQSAAPDAAAERLGVQEGGEPGVDVLPAVYIAAAADGAACTAAVPYLMDGQVESDVVARGLFRCWEEEPDDPEASRCLHALPFVKNITTLQKVLAGLLHSSAAAAAASASVISGRAAPECSFGVSSSIWTSAAQQIAPSNPWEDEHLSESARVRLYIRRRATIDRLPGLLRTAAQQSMAAWRAMLSLLEDSWEQAAACGMLDSLCAALEALPDPVLGEDYVHLRQLIARSAQTASVSRCPLRVLRRTLGMAHHVQASAMQQASELCTLLNQL